MKEKIAQNWDEILEFLRTEYNIKKVSYETWLQNLKFKDVEDNKIIIVVDDEDAFSNISFIQNKYGTFIKNAIAEVLSLDSLPEIEIIAEAAQPSKKPVPEIKNSSNYSSDFILVPDYTFDNFVVSRSNSMVHAAALKVAEAPGEIYNPLYIYGDPGLGKTHLMHAIAHFILDNSPNLKVMYVTSEKFTNEIVDSIRQGNVSPSDVRDKYRNVDILLIDDIQFIIGKSRTQEEFLYTFNYLTEARKQIVISSDKPPRDFTDLDERFRSRFESGLIVDITTPDFETKMAILKKKLEMKQLETGMSIDISDECLAYIADNINTNIRSLEGALTKVIALANLNHKAINMELVEYALKDMIFPNQRKVITPEFIIDVVSEHFDITTEDILSDKRDSRIALPRQIAMYLSKRYTMRNVNDIAKVFRRDHSTVIHGIKSVEDKIKDNPDVENKVDIITKKLNIR